jgi:3-oxoacyl-[acyl-carrier protein] reductase
MARHVVVTGGGTGIGRAIAARFAADGEAVVVTGRRPGPLAEAAAALGPAVRAVPFDAADPADVEAAAAVAFLASPGARRITGQSLHVNGGAVSTR